MEYTDRTEDIEKLLAPKDINKPFIDTALFKLKEASRVPFVYSAGVFEGSKAGEYDIRGFLKEGARLDCCSKDETGQITELSNAYNQLFKLARKKTTEEADIIELHKILSEKTDAQSAGRYREKDLIIAETSFQPPLCSQIPSLMEEFISLMPKMEALLRPAGYAAWLHLNFLNIFPFERGNYACAFILSNTAVLKAGYPLIIIPPVLKQDYYNVLKQAQKDKEPAAFSSFISEMLYEALRDYVRAEGNFIK